MYVRAQEQRLHSVDQQFQPRQIARVVVEQPVRTAGRRAHVAMAVEHGERVGVFQRAARAADGPMDGNVERRFRNRVGVASANVGDGVELRLNWHAARPR